MHWADCHEDELPGELLLQIWTIFPVTIILKVYTMKTRKTSLSADTKMTNIMNN